MPLLQPDFWVLQQTPGFFADRNDGARWLQDHKEDPYWMAHQLMCGGRGEDFIEHWKLASEIKGYSD